jgi:hyperosmotically inducible periplasmic protein
MRGGLIIFVLGVVVGAVGLNYMKERRANEIASTAVEPVHGDQSTTATKPSLLHQARDAAISATDAVSDKLVEWHLSGSDIKQDLAKTGEVVRTNARAAGSSIAAATSNSRIIAVVKAKYTLDKELHARDIEVSCEAGNVTLRGTVATEALIGKAVALALDTDGVVQVKSVLTVQPATSS